MQCDLRGIALIVITHDIALARAVVDEVLVMQGGIAVERGPAAAILDAPMQDYTRTLIQRVPEMMSGSRHVWRRRATLRTWHRHGKESCNEPGRHHQLRDYRCG